ncbi:hypothetical protein ACWA7J_06570 [Leptothrix sp. BB-4]
MRPAGQSGLRGAALITSVLIVSALITSALMLAACGGSGGSDEVATQDVTMTFFRAVPAGTHVIRSSSELDTFWAATPFQTWPIGLLSSEPAKPVYDYGTQAVIGLSLGVGKWCFKPVITAVTRQGNDLVARYRVPTGSTLACLRDGPLIAFALVPSFSGTATFVQDTN